MRHITLDPQVPLALWVPLALATLGLLGWYAAAARRRLSRGRLPVVVALMALAAAVPLVILLNPTWIERMPAPPGKPRLAILIDGSGSMATRDVEGDWSRAEAAHATAERLRRELGERYEIELRTFGTPDSPTTDLAAPLVDALADDRPQGQAVVLLSDGIQNAGARDGLDRLRQGAARAKAMAAPVYTATFGGDAGVEDLAVRLGTPQELAFVAQTVPVVVSLRHRGSIAEPTTVSLLSDGKVIERREVTTTPGDTCEVVFEISRDQPGLYRYEVRAEKLAQEVTDQNNSATLVLRVVDEAVRVLLLEGKPYWDTKFLIRTLAQDASVELVSVVQMRENRFLRRTVDRIDDAPIDAAEDDGPAADETPSEDPDDEVEDIVSTENDAPETNDTSAEDESPTEEAAADNETTDDDEPADEETPTRVVRDDAWAVAPEAADLLADADALAEFQVVVLGRDAEVFLSDNALANVKKWLVEGDGALVCFRGPPASQISQRLGELMPVRWSPSNESRFRMEFTEAGRSLRWLASASDEHLGGMPSLATTALAEQPKALAVVLAEAPGDEAETPQPVISYQPVGSGRVVVVEGAGMWRWAFLPPDYRQHDDVYATLWRSLVRWLVANAGLMPSQEFALRVDKVVFSTTETPTATLLAREDRPVDELPAILLTGSGLESAVSLAPLPSGIVPGQYRVALSEPLPAGSYRLELAGQNDEAAAVAAFDVRGRLDEQLEVAARADVMAMIADVSGGAVLDAAEPEPVARLFDEHLVQSRPERTLQTIAWDRWWILIGAFCLWATAWGLRRRWGLV